MNWIAKLCEAITLRVQRSYLHFSIKTMTQVVIYLSQEHREKLCDDESIGRFLQLHHLGNIARSGWKWQGFH